MSRSFRLAALALVWLVAACHQGQPVKLPFDLFPAQSDGQTSESAGAADSTSARVSGLVAGDKSASPAPLVALGKEQAIGTPRPAGAKASGGEGGETTLTFVDTDIREIARAILGGILKVNYSIDPAVHGTATFETSTPLPRSALLPVLTTLLSQSGATLVERDGSYLVLPSAAAPGTAALTAPGAPTTGSEVVPLRFTSAAQLAKVLEPYAAESGRIVADPVHNALLVSGDGPARASLIALVRAFDVDLLAGQSYALFPVTSGEPGKTAAELQKVLLTEADGRLAGMVRVVPMERTSAVLVISPQARYIEDVKRVYGLLERAQSVTARSWHAYYVQNGESSDLERLLQRAFTPGRVTAEQTAGSTAPGFDTVTLASQGTGSSTSTTSGIGTGTSAGTGAAAFPNAQAAGLPTSATPQQVPTSTRAPSTEPLSAPTGETADEGRLNTIRIISSRRNNVLLIYATPDEYSMVEAMLAKVDVLPLQVMIEATIAEVTLNDSLQYGTQFFFKNGGLNGQLSTITSTSITTPSSSFGGAFPGFVLQKQNSAVQWAISALQDVTQVKVLSSPQIMVLDSEPARLVVGDLVPVITQSAISTVTTSPQVVNSVDYHSTGVILQVMPRVNAGGLITLDISQEVSDVVKTTSSNIDSPTFEERKVRSRVVVQDGQTVGLAGLIRDTASQDNSGVPFLKDIPILGSLASNQDNTRTRTELLILITPRVVRDQREARALTQDMRARLGHANLIPLEKAVQKPSGSSNPNAVLDP
jgi:general secretion pathway protein D